MSKQTSIFFKSGVFISIIIAVKSEYVRHRDNVLNKGVWVKSDKEKLFQSSGFGDYIFKPNSVNVDDLFQDDFYSSGGNRLQDTSFIPMFPDRAKRSPNLLEDGFRKSITDCDGKDCDVKHSPNSIPIIKSTFTPTHKNPTVLSDYPYDVAVLLSQAKNNNKIMLEEVIDKSVESNSIDQVENVSNETNQSNKTFEVIMANEILVDNNITSTTKRSMNKNYESEIIKKIEIVEGVNDSQKYDRSIYKNKVRNWPGSVPAPDVNIYKVIPKSEEHPTVSEKGLLKLLSILTKTFKKIMKQHLEIKKIHSEMFAGKEDIDKSVSLLISKFNDFETKYTDLKDYHEKIQEIQKKLETKEEFFKNKETEMSSNLADFENQQKKFLTQQRQFYNIQKLMLAQNEKINAKQSIIAKTQSEISRRQNNFARILKKAKQILTVKKQATPKSQSKIANSSEADVKVTTTTTTTTAKPDVTESVKIDLFSIPSIDSIRLLNQDQMILKEKDERPVDDLVYKYYFNNTFIDNLIKNQFMTGSLHGSKFMTRNAKAKRNEGKRIKSTVLIPIDNNALDAKVSHNKNSRSKRWIRHHSKGKSRRRHRKITTEYEMKDEKNVHPNANLIKNTEKMETTTVNKIEPAKTQANIITTPDYLKPFKTLEILAKSVERHLNPFTTMAANFCNQIGQNGNPQMLSWCIEKVLRKLQNIENIPVVATLQRAAPTPVTAAPQTQTQQTMPTTVTEAPKDSTPKRSSYFVLSTEPPVTTTSAISTQIPSQATTEAVTTTVHTEISPNVQTAPPGFFPDNDELESNLKQFDLTTDDEGTVFFDGSVHASEVLDKESEGYSDILPGLDSNSRIILDPLTFDMRSMRRASVRKNHFDKINMGPTWRHTLTIIESTDSDTERAQPSHILDIDSYTKTYNPIGITSSFEVSIMNNNKLKRKGIV